LFFVIAIIFVSFLLGGWEIQAGDMVIFHEIILGEGIGEAEILNK